MLSATSTQTSIHFHYTAGAIAPLVAATVLGAAVLARRFPARQGRRRRSARRPPRELEDRRDPAVGRGPGRRGLPAKRLARDRARPRRRACRLARPEGGGRQLDERPRRAPVRPAARAQPAEARRRDLGRRRRDAVELRRPLGAAPGRSGARPAAPEPGLEARLLARRRARLPQEEQRRAPPAGRSGPAAARPASRSPTAAGSGSTSSAPARARRRTAPRRRLRRTGRTGSARRGTAARAPSRRRARPRSPLRTRARGGLDGGSSTSQTAATASSASSRRRVPEGMRETPGQVPRRRRVQALDDVRVVGAEPVAGEQHARAQALGVQPAAELGADALPDSVWRERDPGDDQHHRDSGERRQARARPPPARAGRAPAGRGPARTASPRTAAPSSPSASVPRPYRRAASAPTVNSAGNAS